MKYLEIISQAFPDSDAYALVPDYTYEDIIWVTDPIPKNVLDQANIELHRARKLQEISDARETRLTQGMWFQGCLYDCDLIARSNVSSTCTGILMGHVLSPDFLWRTYDNQGVPFDNAKMKQFGLTMLEYIDKVYVASWQIKAMVEAMTDVQEIKSFEYDHLWPSNDADSSKPTN